MVLLDRHAFFVDRLDGPSSDEYALAEPGKPGCERHYENGTVFVKWCCRGFDITVGDG